MTDRPIRFDALDNFRDFGGYGVGAGRRMIEGRFFRSGHHARLSDADLARLGDLDLGLVVDLRRPVERTRQPSRLPETFTGRVLTSDLDAVAEAPHITFLKTADLTPSSGRNFMTGVYAEMPYAPAYVEIFSAWFRALAETEGSVLVHCAAGKDRTGVLVALTQHMLGVAWDDVLDDYLLTNTAVDLEGRAPAIAEQLFKMTGRRASHDAVVAFMGVEPAYLDATMAAVRERSGSLDVYLSEILGVDEPLRARLRERFSA